MAYVNVAWRSGLCRYSLCNLTWSLTMDVRFPKVFLFDFILYKKFKHLYLIFNVARHSTGVCRRSECYLSLKIYVEIVILMKILAVSNIANNIST